MSSEHRAGFSHDLERIEASALLLDIRDNCIQAVERAIRGLLILGEAGPSSYSYTKAAELKQLVLDPLREGKYDEAWAGIIAFAEDPNMYRMMLLLTDYAEPGVAVLSKAAEYYHLH